MMTIQIESPESTARAAGLLTLQALDRLPTGAMRHQQVADSVLALADRAIERLRMRQPICRDPDDDQVPAWTPAARFGRFVCGDNGLLSLGSFENTPILAPAQVFGLAEAARSLNPRAQARAVSRRPSTLSRPARPTRWREAFRPSRSARSSSSRGPLLAHASAGTSSNRGMRP